MQQNEFSAPFWDAHHANLGRQAAAWASTVVHHAHRSSDDSGEMDNTCRQMVQKLAQAGWLQYAVPSNNKPLDVRALCVLRQTFAQQNALLDFVWVMQALGAGPISLFGSDTQRMQYLPRVAQGLAVPAFALSELHAGSDAAALTCQATRLSPAMGGGYELNGEKAWVSNGGMADFYIVFARLEPAVATSLKTQNTKRTAGISAFIVDANTPGLIIEQRVSLMSPHPMAHLRFDQCRISTNQRIGAEGEGFAIAMCTLDVFRASVAAAAVGMARRAMHEAVSYARQRPMSGQFLADLALTQARIATMAAQIQAAELLMAQAAWLCDQGQPHTQASAMAKWVATENAQKVVDAAVQMCGARAVVAQHPLEQLYRDVRALRIYEGASEIQQLIIARELLRTVSDAESN